MRMLRGRKIEGKKASEASIHYINEGIFLLTTYAEVIRRTEKKGSGTSR